MRRYAMVLMVVVIGPVAVAGFEGDVIFAGGNFWNEVAFTATGYLHTFKGAMALAPVRLDSADPFVGGAPGLDPDIIGGGNMSGSANYELLADEDPRWVGSWGTGNAMAYSRDVIMYDHNTALALFGSDASQDSVGASVWLTQLEYRAGEAIEDMVTLVALPAGGTPRKNATINFFGGADNSIAGGVNSGRLRLALDGGGWRNPVDPRFFLERGNDNAGSYGYFAGAQSGVDAAWGLARDDAGDVYVVGKTLDGGGSPSGVLLKVDGPGSLADVPGQRADQALSIAGTIAAGPAGSAYTGIAYDQGKLFVVDNGSNILEVFDTAGGSVTTLDTFTMQDGAGSTMYLTPEDVDVLSSDAGTTRLIANVLPDTTVGGDAEVKLIVLDYDHSASTFTLVNSLRDGALSENGNTDGAQIDAVDVSPDGDVFVFDLRVGGGDGRHDFIEAGALAGALDGSGLLVSVPVLINDAWGNTSPAYQRGFVFTPEPASVGLLMVGGLALIRRRK